jgi:hypothetical protein
VSNSRNRSVEELEEVHASEAACAVCEGELGWWVTATPQRAGAWIRCESCDDTGHGERIARPRRTRKDILRSVCSGAASWRARKMQLTSSDVAAAAAAEKGNGDEALAGLLGRAHVEMARRKS